MKVGLAACCSEKRAGRREAPFLYCSPLFVLSARAAQTLDEWAILSAKHGLVNPRDELEPYDEALETLRPEEVARWGAKVGVRLRESYPGATFIVFAGKPYQAALAGLDWVDALKGLPIGKRLKALKEGTWTR